MKDCTGKTILNMFTLGKTNLPEEFSFSTLIQHILYHINNNIINKSTMYIIYKSEIQHQGFIAKVRKVPWKVQTIANLLSKACCL